MNRLHRATIALLTGITLASLLGHFAPDAVARRRPYRTAAVQNLLSLFQKKVDTRATRGPICLLTPPAGSETALWSDRPLFAWRPEKVVLVQVQLADRKTPVWSKSIPETQTSIVYDGPALQPGQRYELVLRDRQGRSLHGSTRPQFTILNPTDRNRITTSLDAIALQLHQQKSTTTDIAIAKAQYLLEHDFVADAFQVINAAATDSATMQELTQAIAESACGKSEINVRDRLSPKPGNAMKL